jgi:hypothetical protein
VSSGISSLKGTSGASRAGARAYDPDVFPAEALQRLGAWADRFADPAFSAGTWTPSRTDDDGVIHLGWFDLSDACQAFVSEMYELGFVHNFGWMQWLATPDGQDLAGRPEAVATSSADDLGKLLTAIIRSERFGDGQIEGAFESGLLLAIARRAQEITGASTRLFER